MDDDCELLNTGEKSSTVQNTEDDDPLVAEVDIYLTRLFADQLYVFQYPLRPNHLQFDDETSFIGARLKPKNKHVELDYKLDSESNFHSRTNEQNVTKNWSSTPMETSDNVPPIDHLTLSSTNTTLGDNYKRFAVGLLTPNGIHLSPVNAIFQMRPDFDLTSARRAKTIAEQSATLSDDEDETNPVQKANNSAAEDSATDDENSFKLVTMKFWRPEGRLERERKLRSYNYFERARQEERWIDFAYYASNEDESIDLRHQWATVEHAELHRLPIRWRKTISQRDYFQLLLFNEQSLFSLSTPTEFSNAIENNETTEQKPLIVPPAKTKKNARTKSEKPTKKSTKKSRTQSTSVSGSTSEQKPTSATSHTPLSSVTVPEKIIKQDPEKIQNELLSFIKRRFGYRPYFRLKDINTAIKLELISSDPGHPLATGVTEASILRAVSEIGAIHVNKKWPKNLKQEPIFINTQMGDKYDLLRRYVVDLIEKSDSFQFADLRTRIKQENQNQQFPMAEVRKFVQDHCVTRSTKRGVFYYVKDSVAK